MKLDKNTWRIVYFMQKVTEFDDLPEEMKKKIKEALICLIAGGFVGVLMLYWMLGPLIQF